jgi:hypothetical protein
MSSQCPLSTLTIEEGEWHRVTFCEECDWVHTDSRKQHPGRWLCVQHRRVPGGSFVAPKGWVEHEPYLRCVNVNGGMCLLFEPRRENPNERPGNKRPIQEA